MKKKTIGLLIAGLITLILYTLFSFAVKETSMIWYQTRLFGLLSFAFLFVTILLGELRVLSKIKANLKIFKYHAPIAIFTMFLVALHGIAGFLDQYKWGAQLEWWQYLGFSFSDKWLILLSLGTLSMYLLILVGATSHRKGMQKLGFKRWKVIHLLSYISFLFAFVHSVGLGTDLKTSMLAPILHPIYTIMFLVVVALFITRVLHKRGWFESQRQINLSATFFLVLLLGTTFFTSLTVDTFSTVDEKSEQLQDLEREVGAIEQQVNSLNSKTRELEGQIENVRGGSNGS